MINGVRIGRPICAAGSTRATTKWQEAVQLERNLIKAAFRRCCMLSRDEVPMAFRHFSPGDRS
jgi:hypothetical protein